MGEVYRAVKGDARSLDYSSFGPPRSPITFDFFF